MVNCQAPWFELCSRNSAVLSFGMLRHMVGLSFWDSAHAHSQSPYSVAPNSQGIATFVPSTSHKPARGLHIAYTGGGVNSCLAFRHKSLASFFSISNAILHKDRNPCFSYKGLPMLEASIQHSTLRSSATDIPAFISREPTPWRRWVGITDIQFNARVVNTSFRRRKLHYLPRCGRVIQLALGLYTCSKIRSQNSLYSPFGHHGAVNLDTPSLNGFLSCTSHCAQPTTCPLSLSTTKYQVLEGEEVWCSQNRVLDSATAAAWAADV
jgi:hypothetical protein